MKGLPEGTFSGHWSHRVLMLLVSLELSRLDGDLWTFVHKPKMM